MPIKSTITITITQICYLKPVPSLSSDLISDMVMTPLVGPAACGEVRGRHSPQGEMAAGI
jgi:hypothetical protein